MSPLRTAIRRKHLDIVLLFLCNGYRLDLEANDADSVLDEALRARDFEILDLLLKWGADATKVGTENVIDTYKSDLIDRFWRAGVDYTEDPRFVVYLAHTVNKPLYGWLRKNRSDARLQNSLDAALLEAVTKDEELPARLLLWAGADPHRRVPMAYEVADPEAWLSEGVFSSAEAAISFGRHGMLDLLRVDEIPELDAQAASAHDSRMLKRLVALRPPSDWAEVILTFIRRFCDRHGFSSSWDARDALRFIESSGGRLTTISPDQLRYLRRELLEIRSEDDFRWLLKWLKKDRNCEPGLYGELIRTTAMRQKLKALADGARYLSPSQKMSREIARRRRTAVHRS